MDKIGNPAPVQHSKKSTKRVKRQPEKVLANIIEAATVAFERDGYKGARMRSIAADAGITIQLLVYHVKTKERLWEIVMEHLLTEYRKYHESRRNADGSSSAVENLRQLISDIAYFHAKHPELHRIMTQEGALPSPRLTWITERFTRSAFEEFTSLVVEARREGNLRTDIDPARIWYAILGIVAVPLSVTAEYQYLTGKDPSSTIELKKTTDLIDQLLFDF
ncbi:MAG: TetR/AcrR family transcriptional regulator [Pseudomonadota bacterium]